MAISLSCPSCRRKLKVKDELAGRKIKCPECSEVVVVPEPEQLVKKESPNLKQSAAKLDMEEPLPDRPRPATQGDDKAPPLKRKKKGILSMDVNELNEAFKNFDVRRFTIIGWILLAVSIVVAFGAYLLVEMNYESIMDVPKNQRVYTKWFAPYAIATAVSGMGCFFGGWGIFHVIGLQVIRPKPDADRDYASEGKRLAIKKQPRRPASDNRDD